MNAKNQSRGQLGENRKRYHHASRHYARNSKVHFIVSFYSGEFATIGDWTMNSGEDGELHLDDLSLVEPPLALKQKNQILKVQTVTVRRSNPGSVDDFV